MYGGPLEQWQGPLQREHSKTKNHGQYLDDRYLDNDINKTEDFGRRLQATRVSQNTPDEIPEELAVKQSPIAGPNRVDTSSDGNEAAKIVPDEIAHDDLGKLKKAVEEVDR